MAFFTKDQGKDSWFFMLGRNWVRRRSGIVWSHWRVECEG